MAATPQQAARSASAGFEWSGDGTAGTLVLSTAVGTRMAEARWRPGLAELSTPDGTSQFDTLESLAERLLGERLPMQALADWLRGRPWPGAVAEPLPAGPVSTPWRSFRQSGWEVDLSRHAEGRIEARRREPPPAVELRIRLDPDAP